MAEINYKRLIVSLLLPQLAGVLGAIFTSSSVNTWFAGLTKPEFNPPSWLFGPVWTLLYVLMGVSIYLIWGQISKHKEVKVLFWLFWAHLFFNFIWSPIFFGWHEPSWALVDIIVIWLLIVVMVWQFWRFSRVASLLLWPYLLWVSFATILNYYLMILN